MDLKPLGTTRLKVKNPETQKKYSVEFVVVPDNDAPDSCTYSTTNGTENCASG